MRRQDDRPPAALDHGGVQDQVLMGSRRDTPIEPPFEERRRECERKGLEQVLPVDMEENLGTQPSSESRGSTQSRVKIRKSLGIVQDEIRVQQSKTRDHARESRL
jgi:hypothetical protein